MMVVTVLEHNTSSIQSTSTGMQLGWGWGKGVMVLVTVGNSQSPTPTFYRVHPWVCGGDEGVVMLMTVLEHDTSSPQSTFLGVWWGWRCSDVDDSVGV